MKKNSYGTRQYQLAERAKFWHQAGEVHASLRAWHEHWLEEPLPAPEPYRFKEPGEPSPPAAEEPPLARHVPGTGQPPPAPRGRDRGRRRPGGGAPGRERG